MFCFIFLIFGKAVSKMLQKVDSSECKPIHKQFDLLLQKHVKRHQTHFHLNGRGFKFKSRLILNVFLSEAILGQF